MLAKRAMGAKGDASRLPESSFSAYHGAMRSLRIIFILCVLASFGAGCLRIGGSGKPSEKNPQDAVESLPFASFNETGTSDSVGTLQDGEALPEASQDAEPKQGERMSASKNVVVSSPAEGQVLGNPFIILGRARAFENVANWRVRDDRNTVLAEGYFMTDARDAGLYGAFRIRAFFNVLPETDKGRVEVFTLSPRDGSEQDMVSIPVSFEEKRLALKVFYSNLEKDPNMMQCEKTYAVTRRVVYTQNTAEAALLELLKQPTTQERVQGSRTSIIPGVTLRSVSVDAEGVAIADFSRDIVLGLGGSCNVQALQSQIRETLLQFPSIKAVKIYIEGQDAEEQIQP